MGVRSSKGVWSGVGVCVFSRGVATVSNVEVIHGPVHTIHGLIISTSAKTITRAYRNRVSHR